MKMSFSFVRRVTMAGLFLAMTDCTAKASACADGSEPTARGDECICADGQEVETSECASPAPSCPDRPEVELISDPGESASSATDLGVLTSPASLCQNVGTVADLQDFYVFKLDRDSLVSVTLTDVSVGNHMELHLAQDKNTNGILEPSETTSFTSGTIWEGTSSIDWALPKNTAILLEARLRPDVPGVATPIEYVLNLAAAPGETSSPTEDPGESPSEAIEVEMDSITGGYVGFFDPTDYFAIVVDGDTTKRVQFTAAEALGGSVTLAVAKDSNKNRVVEAEEILLPDSVLAQGMSTPLDLAPDRYLVAIHGAGTGAAYALAISEAGN